MSHYSGKASQGARLSWHLQATNRRGELILSGAPRGSAGLVGTIELTMPEVQDTCSIDLELWLHDLSGNLLSSNQQTLRIYPRSASLAPQVGPLAVLEAEIEPVYAGAQVDQHRPGKDFLSDRLEHAGYQTAAQITPDVRVAVSGNPTRELLEWVRQGGRLLYFSQGSGPFFWNHQRAGAYSGSWISSFTWADPHVHRRLQPNNPLGMEAVEIMPRGTILGLPFAKAMADGDILSGMVSGWIHHPAAHTVQFRYGKGVVIMTTYELRTHLAVDPTATVMLHDLIEYLDSDRCQPTLVSNY